MFWTEHIAQLHLFDDGFDDVQKRTTISSLIAFAKMAFPSQPSDFHRHFAFLEHHATHVFLKPLVIQKFGSLDAAKEPTLTWLEECGSFETFARSCRNGLSASSPSNMTCKRIPEWYDRYLSTQRCQQMKSLAMSAHEELMGELTCAMNARHPFELMHHRDYGRLGEDDEYRFMIPLCDECHEHMRLRGPAVPADASGSVNRWL